MFFYMGGWQGEYIYDRAAHNFYPSSTQQQRLTVSRQTSSPESPQKQGQYGLLWVLLNNIISIY
jgi:hypothetical protein